MPELFSVLLKINVALLLFCSGYYLVLRKLTFYTLNRVYLLTAILFSSAYPIVDFSAFAQEHQQILAPVQQVVITWKAPAESLISQTNYWTLLEILFWTGTAIFACKLLMQMISLYRIYHNSTGAKINGQKVRVVKGDISPFSFWQSIFINPQNLSATDLNNILAHEQVHVKEWHTLDILLSEISVIFYWFNPGVWMMKRAIRENIEFITDRKILQKGTDSKVYQYSLLNVTFNQHAPAITSNFNFSTLKKRIMMMNAKRSSNLNLTRYALLLPIVVLCLFVFTLSKAETLKISTAVKKLAVTVTDIAPATFTSDTTPAKKTVTKRIKLTKGSVVKANAAAKTQVKKLLQGTDKQLVKNALPADSTVFIVNGKIVPDIKNIDPNIIQAIAVVKDNAPEYVKNVTGKTMPADKRITAAVVVTVIGSTKSKVALRPGYNHVEILDYSDKTKFPLSIDTTAQINFKNFKGAPEPLIIVNGKESSFEKLNQDDIESLSVLKGGSATTKYGEKGKNGVIVVTLKTSK